MDTSKNEGLQAARAIAALSVAYFHSYVAVRGFPEAAWMPIPWLKQWGFLGVDFFFAVSGYVICLVASKPSFAFRSFAIKRIFRLYPMYWVTMALIVALIWWGRLGPIPTGHFFYSMTLLPQHGPPAFEISWTLEREMVFYALTAVIVPFGGIWSLAIVLFGLGAAGLYYQNPWSFHLVSTYQLDFFAGVFVFLLRRPLLKIGGSTPLALGIAALALMTQQASPYMIPVSAGLMLAGTAHIQLPWHRAPFRWIVSIGDASYSIYLLHYLVFVVMAYASAAWLKLPQLACEPWRFASIGACAFISWLTWRLIERPMIDFGNCLISKNKDSLSHDDPYPWKQNIFSRALGGAGDINHLMSLIEVAAAARILSAKRKRKNDD